MMLVECGLRSIKKFKKKPLEHMQIALKLKKIFELACETRDKNFM